MIHTYIPVTVYGDPFFHGSVAKETRKSFRDHDRAGLRSAMVTSSPARHGDEIECRLGRDGGSWVKVENDLDDNWRRVLWLVKKSEDSKSL